jgi:hypothetical protein
MTDQIHVLFSEEGEACAIRKWSKEPFYDAQTYVQKALLDTLAARVLELEAENRRLREGLDQIDALEADWTKGVDENLERAKSIARAALKGGEI